MPIYEFRCTKNHEFEYIQSVNAPNPKCPKCKAETEKLDSVPAPRNPDFGIQR